MPSSLGFKASIAQVLENVAQHLFAANLEVLVELESSQVTRAKHGNDLDEIHFVTILGCDAKSPSTSL